MQQHRQVVIRAVLSSLALAIITSIAIKYLWQFLFAASVYPLVYQVQLVAFFVTLVVASPVLYAMFYMSLCVSLKNHELFQLANLDPLTGIYNRRALADRFARLARKGRRNNQFGMLMVIDVDKFKTINDQYGHEIGDKVLTHLADSLRQFKTGENCFARLGGEEFAFANFGGTETQAFEFAEKIRKHIEGSPVHLSRMTIEYTVSIGYASIAENDTLNTALRHADAALYTAKRTGRNRTIRYSHEAGTIAPNDDDLLPVDEKRSFSHALSNN